MRHALSLSLLLLLALPAWAQSVVLPAEVKGEVREWMMVVPDKVAKDARLNWRVGPGLVDETARIEKLFGQKAAGKILRAPLPGRYKVEVWVTGDSELPLDRSAVLTILSDKSLSDAVKVESAQALLNGVSVCWVVVGDPGPEPPPIPPGPKPDPPGPAPTAAKLWLIVVHETADATPAVGKVLGDYALQKELVAAGHKWRTYDKDDPAAKAKYLAYQSESGGLPLLLILDQQSTPPGKKLRAVRLPPTADALRQLVKEVSGGK